MKLVAIVVLSSIFCSAAAHDHDENDVLNEGSELAEWCRAEVEAPYIARGITPFNWTASHYSRSNVLYVYGGLRADNSELTVKCRVAKGARKKYATIEVSRR